MSLECLSGGNCSAPVQGFPLKKEKKRGYTCNEPETSSFVPHDLLFQNG